jgi:hypothetical protein
MKAVRDILMTFALVTGLSLAIAAQKHDDGKKPPPKPSPPVVTPQPKNPPPDSKPKKPGEAAALWRRPEEA